MLKYITGAIRKFQKQKVIVAVANAGNRNISLNQSKKCCLGRNGAKADSP
jgi:hypothetical protein